MKEQIIRLQLLLVISYEPTIVSRTKDSSNVSSKRYFYAISGKALS